MLRNGCPLTEVEELLGNMSVCNDYSFYINGKSFLGRNTATYICLCTFMSLSTVMRIPYSGHKITMENIR